MSRRVSISKSPSRSPSAFISARLPFARQDRHLFLCFEASLKQNFSFNCIQILDSECGDLTTMQIYFFLLAGRGSGDCPKGRRDPISNWYLARVCRSCMVGRPRDFLF